ncbi:MAG: ADP-ribosylation factor-like protein [Promethearchaeota archaeon]
MVENKSKICFFGDAGVGKSSLISLLQGRAGESLDTSTKPTIGLEIEESIINGSKYTIWDLGGQKRFKLMWDDFLKNSGLAVLVCDSTEDNLKKTKELYDRFSHRIGSKVIAIANKQDLPGALKADVMRDKLGGIPTYEMSAIRLELRDRMKSILEYEMYEKKK